MTTNSGKSHSFIVYCVKRSILRQRGVIFVTVALTLGIFFLV